MHISFIIIHSFIYLLIFSHCSWTAVTADGERSAQFEHTLLVTETGVEILTKREGSSLTEIVWDVDALQR